MNKILVVHSGSDLTRRLVDVAQDMVVNEVDCGTLRGLVVSSLKDNEEIVEPLSERIMGKVSVHAIYGPLNDELRGGANKEITEEIDRAVEATIIEEVKIRSVLNSDTKQGV